MPPAISVHEVFTPTTPAKLTFVERDSINDRLVDSLRVRGKQLIVYGHSGSGKTTLLQNKLHQTHTNHLTTRCVKGMSFQQIILNGFDQLSPYYVASSTTKSTTKVDASLSGEYLGIKSQLGVGSALEQGSTKERVLPPQLTVQTLARLIGAAQCAWVLEDFHKIAPEEKVHLAQAMKVFMDMAVDFPGLKIIAIGAVDTAREVVQYDPEMRNRVAEIKVPLMDRTELEQILAKGETLLNVQFSDTLKKGIVHYSNGVASVCHNLGLSLCVTNGIETRASSPLRLGESSLQRALERYIDDSSDTLKSLFDRAFHTKRRTKYDNFRLLIEALCEFDQDGTTKSKLLEKIRVRHRRYPASNFDYCLKTLQSDDRGSLIRIDSSARVTFVDPIYRAFALAFFKKTSGQKNIQLTFDDVFGRDLFNELQGEILRYVISRESKTDFDLDALVTHPPRKELP